METLKFLIVIGIVYAFVFVAVYIIAIDEIKQKKLDKEFSVEEKKIISKKL